MPKKFVPYDKMSKRRRREENRKKRNDWGNLNPIPRIVPDKRDKFRDKASRKEDSDV